MAQEKRPPATDDKVSAPDSPISEFDEGIDSKVKKTSNKKKANKSKKNVKPKSPYILAANKRKKREYYFAVGEFVKYKSGSEKEKKSGTIEAIEGNMVTINGQKVSIKNMSMLGKRLGETMRWRTKGVSNFAVGTGIAAVGTAFSIVSAQYINLDSPRVVWGTFGATIGAGTALVGFHLMGKGGKEFFQPSKLWKDKGWTFQVK
jgi:hypothetical protein